MSIMQLTSCISFICALFITLGTGIIGVNTVLSGNASKERKVNLSSNLDPFTNHQSTKFEDELESDTVGVKRFENDEKEYNINHDDDSMEEQKHHLDEQSSKSESLNKDWIGIVNIEPSQASNAFGTIYITQTKFSDTVIVHGQISNLPKADYAMEIQSFREHKNNCPDTDERLNSNEEPLPDNIHKMATGKEKAENSGVYLGNFVSTNSSGITTVFMRSSIVKLKSLDIHNVNNNFIAIRSQQAENVGSKVACGFIRQLQCNNKYGNDPDAFSGAKYIKTTLDKQPSINLIFVNNSFQSKRKKFSKNDSDESILSVLKLGSKSSDGRPNIFSYANDSISFHVKPEFLRNVTENKSTFDSEVLPSRLSKKDSYSSSDKKKDTTEINHGEEIHDDTAKRKNGASDLDYENNYSAYPDNKGNSYQANETIEDTSYEDSLFQHLTSETANFKHFNESKLEYWHSHKKDEATSNSYENRTIQSIGLMESKKSKEARKQNETNSMIFRELNRQSEVDNQHMKSKRISKAEVINSVEQTSHELLSILNEQLKGDIVDDVISSNEQYLIENNKLILERDVAENKLNESNISESNTNMKSLKAIKGKNLTNTNQHLEETAFDSNGNDYSMTYADDSHTNQSIESQTAKSKVVIQQSSNQIDDDFSKEYHATEEGNYSG